MTRIAFRTGGTTAGHPGAPTASCPTAMVRVSDNPSEAGDRLPVRGAAA
ncbi:hypothetical protein [Saccharothrix violaceirubra]|uniref:Uncharacterized protein n=1 Tax=Saccharothrix violaceirubra TaxID=413306 RepID=A0A7W7T017_9PSEU|nr:hypothetical protein [Saccharothrix violaceirubra]MBB4963492.1 hypothetical protein [Saccharothrix violaceirubra]